jgi:hypothetical protein
MKIGISLGKPIILPSLGKTLKEPGSPVGSSHFVMPRHPAKKFTAEISAPAVKSHQTQKTYRPFDGVHGLLSFRPAIDFKRLPINGL